jgi:hypothetical protein
MTPFELLSRRLNDHAYKRGKFKGDAPLEKRTKRHIRIRQVDDNTMAVHMHETDILTVRKDGTFTVNLDRWWSSSTTKTWLNYAFHITRLGMSIGSKSVMSLSQLVVSTPHGHYVYYNGMEFNADRQLTSPPMKFLAKRINKAEVAEFKKGIQESGFKDMFPMLYGMAEHETEPTSDFIRNMTDFLTNSDNADRWLTFISKRKYDRRWTFNATGVGHTYGIVEVGDAKSCWDGIMKAAKSGMYDNLETEVTVIPK